MSQLSEIALSNFSSNPDRIFFSSIDRSFTGRECLELIQSIQKTFGFSKKKSIGLYSENNLFWPLIYIAADLTVSNIYVFHSNLQKQHVEKLKNQHDIEFVYHGQDLTLDPQEETSLGNLETLTKKRDSSRQDILFTSGTTGLPKGVRIKEESFIHVARNLVNELDQNASDSELLSMPFGHSFGLVRLRSVILSGCSAFISNGLKDFPAIYKYSQTYPFTGLSFVPAALEVVKGLLRRKAKEFGKSIKYIELGSSFLSEPTDEWLKENFPNAIIIHHYGMTEASRSFLRPRGLNDTYNLPNNWIGIALDGCEYRIGSSNEVNQANGIKGELFLRGKNLFSGYLNQIDFEGSSDWFATRDICEEKNGHLFLLGRTDNQFNIGGEKIQAEDLESRIISLKEIHDAVAFQMPDKILGSKLACLIQLADNNIVDESLYREISLKTKDLEGFMKPKIYFTSQELLKTNNGKKIRNEDVLNKYLLEDYVSELTK